MKCGLYELRQKNALPPGTERAWLLYHELAAPGVQELGLQDLAVEAFCGGLTRDDGRILLRQLNAIGTGYATARREARGEE